jgi:elongation factor 1-alpha
MNNEIAIAICGSVDSGKSTLIGTLLSGKLDDGNGLNRKLAANHIHEIKTGKTSSISVHSIKNFNTKNKSIIMVDLCGHEKYLKTTLYGMMGYYPDYAILVISANRGIIKMTKEHIKILYHLKIPIIIILTKTDLNDKLYDTVQLQVDSLNKITLDIKKMFLRGNYNVIDMNELADLPNNNISDIKPNQTTIPLFKISCKTGYGLNILKDYICTLPRVINIKLGKTLSYFNDNTLNTLTDKKEEKEELEIRLKDNDCIFYVETIYNPPGIGWVITGILKCVNEDSYISAGTIMYLGPRCTYIINQKTQPLSQIPAQSQPQIINSDPIQVKVWSIYNYYNERIDKLLCGQRGCIAIRGDKKLTRNIFQKGIILTNNINIIKNASNIYRAKIKLLNHPTNVKDNFTPVIHSGTIRQAAKLKIIYKETNEDNNNLDSKCIYPGDTAIIEISFLYRPEIIESNQMFFLREGLTLGVGTFL